MLSKFCCCFAKKKKDKAFNVKKMEDNLVALLIDYHLDMDRTEEKIKEVEKHIKRLSGELRLSPSQHERLCAICDVIDQIEGHISLDMLKKESALIDCSEIERKKIVLLLSHSNQRNYHYYRLAQRHQSIQTTNNKLSVLKTLKRPSNIINSPSTASDPLRFYRPAREESPSLQEASEEKGRERVISMQPEIR